MLRTTAVLLLALAPSAALAAPCAIWGLKPTVAHRSSSAPISAAGGFVVMVEPTQGQPNGAPGTELVIQPWQLRTARGAVKPVIDVIAPGLAVYRVPTGATSVKLEAGKTVLDSTAIAAATDKRPPLDAPRLASIKREDTQSRHPNTSVVVELAERAPAHAVALVVTDPKGKPLAWGRPVASEVVVYTTGGGCVAMPAGTVLSNVGDQVATFWVDEVGRVSPASKPIVVGKP